jgi:hypothetical protein
MDGEVDQEVKHAALRTRLAAQQRLLRVAGGWRMDA